MDKLMAPVEAPLQRTLVFDEVALIAKGSFMVIVVLDWQSFASSTTYVQVPAFTVKFPTFEYG